MGDKNSKTGKVSWADLESSQKATTAPQETKKVSWADLEQPQESADVVVEPEEVIEPTEEPTITTEQPQYLKPPVPVLKTEPEFFNPDVTQMKPIGVVQQPPKKLPYSEKLEKRIQRTPEQIVQEQTNAFDILAKDYAEDGMTLPGFIPPAKTQFIDPVHPINKITNPNGDPVYTAQYRNTKIGKLRDQLKNAAIYESGSEIELRPVIEKKIEEINSAAEKVIDLQLFNREYKQKKYTPEQSKYEIATIQNRLIKDKERHEQNIGKLKDKFKSTLNPELMSEINNAQAAFNFQKQQYEKQQQEIINNSKYDKSMLGAEKEALFGNKQAQQDLASLKAGRPINPELKYKYDQIGRDIINEGLESTVNENVKKEAAPYADADGKQIKAQNKEFIKQKAKEDIGNRKYRDETVGNQILNAIIPSALRPDITPEQITKYAKEIGVDDDVAKELIEEKDSIPKEISLAQQYIKGAGDFLAPALYERAVRSIAFTQGKNVDDMFPPGWQEQRGIIAKIAGNMPTEQNSIHNVRGVAGAMASTIGMLQSFGPIAKTVAAPIESLGVKAATSEKLANFGIMAFEGYNGAYQQAKDIVGDKPEDEWRRQLYSMASGGISGLIFSMNPMSKYAIVPSGEMKKTAEQFLNEIKNTGMKNILTPKVTSKFANHIIEMGKMEGLVITQATANKLAQNTLYNIAKPGTENDLATTEGLGEDVMHTALTFLIPSVMSGYGIAKQRTPLNKAAIFDIGTHAKEYTDWVNKQVAEGKMTKFGQGAQLISDIAKIKAAQEDTPPVNDDGQLLTPDQIKNYTFSLLQQRALQSRLDQLSREAKARNVQVDKAQEGPIKQQIAELIYDNEAILEGAVIPEARPTQEPPIVPENREQIVDLTADPAEPSKPTVEAVEPTEPTIELDEELAQNYIRQIEEASQAIVDGSGGRLIAEELRKLMPGLEAYMKKNNLEFSDNAIRVIGRALYGEAKNKPEENLVVSEEKDITLQPTTVTEDKTSQKPNENEEIIINAGAESNQVGQQGAINGKSPEVRPDAEVRADADAKGGQEEQLLEPEKETEEPQRAPVNGEPAEVVLENKPKKARRMFVEEEVVVPTPEQPAAEAKAKAPAAEVKEVTPAPTPKTPEVEVKPEQVSPEPANKQEVGPVVVDEANDNIFIDNDGKKWGVEYDEDGDIQIYDWELYNNKDALQRKKEAEDKRQKAQSNVGDISDPTKIKKAIAEREKELAKIEKNNAVLAYREGKEGLGAVLEEIVEAGNRKEELELEIQALNKKLNTPIEIGKAPIAIEAPQQQKEPAKTPIPEAGEAKEIAKAPEVEEVVTKKDIATLKAKLTREVTAKPPKTTAAQKAKEGRIEKLKEKIAEAEAKFKEQEKIQAEKDEQDIKELGENEEVEKDEEIDRLSPAQKRKDGKYTANGILYERNEEQQVPVGDSGKVQFSKGVEQEFEYVLIEADELQPSHVNGAENPRHFIPEAQPKDRSDVGSVAASDKIASDPDISQVGESPNAYFGAPVINARGEVVQGNNRGEGLKKHYKAGGEEYKKQLAKAASKFGLTAEQVNSMKSPILVRRMKVSDQNAIRLGNYDVKDLETGGQRRIDPVATSRRISDNDKAVIAEIAFSDSEDKTLNEVIREGFDRLFNVIRKYLSPSQVDSMLNSGGDPKMEAISDMEQLVKQFLFDGGNIKVSTFFENLEKPVQSALQKALPQIFGVSNKNSLVKEIQNAIVAHENYKRANMHVGTWLIQGDAFSPGPREIYSPFELRLLDIFIKAKTELGASKKIIEMFEKYAKLVNGGTKDMFGEGTPPKTKAEAIKEIFNVDNYEQPRENPTGGERQVNEAVGEGGGTGVDKEAGVNKADAKADAEKAIEAGYDKIIDKIEKGAENYQKQSDEQTGGMVISGLGFSTRVGDNIVAAIAKAAIALVRAGKNVHLAIYRAIEQVKANDPEGAKGLEYEDIDTLNKIFNITPERPKELPELSKTNREIADEWVNDIRKGELTYGEAVVEVMQAEGLKDATRENILNYMNFRLYKEAAHTIPHPEPKEGNLVAEATLDESGVSKFLGEKTTEDIYGEEGVADEMGEDKVALRLESMMQSARDMTTAYKDKLGGLATKWGAKMFSDIKDVPNDPKRQATALVGLQAELQSERIRNEMDLRKLSSDLANNPTPENRQKILEAIEATTTEQQRLRALTAQVQNYWKKLASTSSDVLNIRRGDRMMRDAMMGEYYAERILNEQQVREMREVEKALTADVMQNYKNHPQYKAEMSIKKEKARSQARARREKKKQEQAEGKEGVVSKTKEKVKDVVEAVTGNRKKEAEKMKESALNDFPLNDKGQRMTKKEFLEFIKKLKKPC